MRATNVDEERFGEPKMNPRFSGFRAEGHNAGDIVEITDGERKGQKGRIFFLTPMDHAWIQFEDGGEGQFEPNQYRDPPEEVFNTQLADRMQAIRDKLKL